MRVFQSLIILAVLCVAVHGFCADQTEQSVLSDEEAATLLATARTRLERIGVVHIPSGPPASEVGDSEPPGEEFLGSLPNNEERYELLDEVEADLRLVVASLPSADAYHLLGITRLLQLDPDRAASAFRIAMDLGGPSQERYNYLVTALIEAGRLDDALRTAEEYIRAYPADELQGLSMLSNISLYAMDAEAMERVANRMLVIDPNNLDALITLASADAVRGNWEEAERKFEAIAASHPEVEEDLELLKDQLFVLQP
ncbi:MAG: hypothetical protein R6W92_02485 [Desulfocurvibacter africanus]